MDAKKTKKRRSRVSASLSATLKKRLQQASTAQSRTMSEVIADALESKLPELPVQHIAKGRTWVDELAGTVSFTDEELAGDERLERLVMRARRGAVR